MFQKNPYTLPIFIISVVMAIFDIMESTRALENPVCSHAMSTANITASGMTALPPTKDPVLAILTICFGATHILRAAGIIGYWCS
jgi:hypothetical protein